MEARVVLLESQVAQLLNEVTSLRRQLTEVNERLSEALREPGASSSVLDSPSRLSLGSFSLATSRRDSAYPSPSLASQSVPRGGGQSVQRPVDSRSPSGSLAADSRGTSSNTGGGGTRISLSWDEREDICRGIADWLHLALGELHRGSSGRDRIPLGSRIWVVARDFTGLTYTPVRVFRAFGPCKDLVKRGPDCGDSVFVGLPSEREARWVVRQAGLEWPEEEG